MQPNVHQPVLLAAVLDALRPQPGQCIVDGTLGGGGYTRALAAAVGPTGRVVALDADPDAVARWQASNPPENVTVVQANFQTITNVCEHLGITTIDGAVLDLGLSSNQLEASGRGFSFQEREPLDLRFDYTEEAPTAADILHQYTQTELRELFRQYGEEPLAGKVARAITTARATQPIVTTEQLANLVAAVYANHFHSRSVRHPATRVFQALRIAVNRELEVLTDSLPRFTTLLAPGGRLAVVSFHSGEDRIVKNFFRTESRDCLCPPAYPSCRCGHQATLTVVTKKPIVPSPLEIVHNPRARSAKLRVAEKLP